MGKMEIGMSTHCCSRIPLRKDIGAKLRKQIAPRFSAGDSKRWAGMIACLNRFRFIEHPCLVPC